MVVSLTSLSKCSTPVFRQTNNIMWLKRTDEHPKIKMNLILSLTNFLNLMGSNNWRYMNKDLLALLGSILLPKLKDMHWQLENDIYS